MELNQDEIDRFFNKVNKTDKCWEWTGSTSEGYGNVALRRGKRKTFSAHRVSWAIHNATAIPPRKMVCHTCDNRKCVNPEHLYVGTGYNNNRDTIARNRGNRKKGENCSWAKLTEDDVRAIRQSTESQNSLAKRHGIDQSTVSDIKNLKLWKHISY
jgi:hypothetical protein